MPTIERLPPISPEERSAAEQPQRSAAMMAVVRNAETHIRSGMELGGRRAYLSARAELIEAMRLLADALDAEAGTDEHGKALAAGLKALDEADDLAPREGEIEADLDLPSIVALHKTPVVRESPEGLTPTVAAQQYYAYAQEQLARGLAHEPAGSVALAALGKLYIVMSGDQVTEIARPMPKAMVLHQAALTIDQNNPVAANELGVLLARIGRYEEARGWLEYSVSLAPQPATWHNLAVVQSQLGQLDRAQQARRQELAAGKVLSPNRPEVRWVAPQEFSATPGQQSILPAKPAGPPAHRTTAAPDGASDRAEVERGSLARLPRLEPPPPDTSLK
jgi:tetratricopeptide (TPR) repeat protein